MTQIQFLLWLKKVKQFIHHAKLKCYLIILAQWINPPVMVHNSLFVAWHYWRL